MSRDSMTVPSTATTGNGSTSTVTAQAECISTGCDPTVVGRSNSRSTSMTTGSLTPARTTVVSFLSPTWKISRVDTPSEKNVLREIALGKTTKEIAIEKHLSFHTVNAHRRNIYRKLGVNSLSEVTRYALQAGLADPVEYYI